MPSSAARAPRADPTTASAPAPVSTPTPRAVPAAARPVALTSAPPAVRLNASQAAETRGEPLAPGVREELERTFRADLRAVRVHSGGKAQGVAIGLSARAVTHGTDIFLGPGEQSTDVALLAHEVAHVVQQQGVRAAQRFTAGGGDRFEHEAQRASAAAVRGDTFEITERTGDARVQRLGIGDALDFFARQANNIPGFRMFTIVIGINPINMSAVDRSAANVLRAAVEFMPGGGLITQALDNYGIFERAGAWVDTQLRTLGMTGSMFRSALMEFVNSLGLTDLFDLGGVWDRAVRIFTGPIQRLKDFIVGLVTGILRLIREAVLRPLAALAEGTRGYDLLKAVLGQDPVTGEPVPRNAETLIGGFMKLIGQEEVWENIKRGNAIARAWAWFQGALQGLMGYVRQIPQLFVSALQSLEIADLVLLPRAFSKVAGVFGGFIGQFLSWAGQQVMALLQIIFEVVAPGVMPYIRRAAGAFRTIVQNPIGFIGNLVRAGIQGFRQFAGNFLTHLRNSLIQWLTGTLSGASIYIPRAFTLLEIVKFVLSVLGLTWQSIRAKLVRAVGETAVTVLETGFDIVVTLVRQGPAAAWEKIREAISNLREMVMEQVMTFVRDRIVTAAITRLVTSLNPAGAFIQAIIAIYNTIMFLVERLRQIAQVVGAFIDSIAAIAAGQIGAAANRVEQTMGGLLTLVISFLARLVGLGRVSDAVLNIVNRVRAPIDRALDRVVAWIVSTARRLGRMVSTAARNLLGQLFRRRGFAAGGEGHTAWVSEQGEPMVASDVMPLADRITNWRGRLRDLETEPRGRARGMLDQAHGLRVQIRDKSRQVIAAQRAQDEATIRARQPEIEQAYATLVPILQQLFILFGDVVTPRGAAMDTEIARVFNAYDQEVLPLKRGRPQRVTGSPVGIYSQLQALWNQDAGWAYQMAHGILFQMQRVLASARHVGTTTYPQLTGVEVRVPPYRRGSRTVSGTRVDYTEKDRALVGAAHVDIDIGVEVKRYGATWDSDKVERELGKIRRQVRAQIQSNQPRFDVIRLEIGGFSNTPANFQSRLDTLWVTLQAEATPRNITLERRNL